MRSSTSIPAVVKPAMPRAGRKRIVVLDQHERTSTVRTRYEYHDFKREKKWSAAAAAAAAAADVAAAATTAAVSGAHEASIGSASQCGRLVGRTLEPFVRVPGARFC